jgi:hypothetical protein
MSSKAFSGEHPQRPHLLRGGGMGKEVKDTRDDVDNALELLEARDATLEYPELDWIDGGFVAAAGGDIVIKGRYLLQGQSFAELTIGTGTAELVFTALKPGEGGNDITVEIEDGGTAGSEVVTKTGNAFVITAEVGTSTADQIATAVNANAADSDGYIRCNGGGAGTPAVTAATALTGGVGDGWECRISGVECLPANTTGTNGAAAIAEGVCTVTVPDLTAETDARAVGDSAAVHIKTNNVRTQAISGLLA